VEEENDYHKGIKKLNTSLKYNMKVEKEYKIFVYRYQKFAGHHVIVISDQQNNDIIFGLQVNSTRSQAIIGKGRAIAQVDIFDGNKSHLEFKGPVTCTLHELAVKAGRILDQNSVYNLANNNCQNFCNKFLKVNDLPTYATDVEKAGIFAGMLSIVGFKSSSSTV